MSTEKERNHTSTLGWWKVGSSNLDSIWARCIAPSRIGNLNKIKLYIYIYTNFIIHIVRYMNKIVGVVFKIWRMYLCYILWTVSLYKIPWTKNDHKWKNLKKKGVQFYPSIEIVVDTLRLELVRALGILWVLNDEPTHNHACINN